jgi:hypothetical protein
MMNSAMTTADVDWSSYCPAGSAGLPTIDNEQRLALNHRFDNDTVKMASSLAAFFIATNAPMPPTNRLTEDAARIDFNKLTARTYKNVADNTVAAVTMSCAVVGDKLGALKLGAAHSSASNYFQHHNRVHCGGYNKLSPHQAWSGDGLTTDEHLVAMTKIVRATPRNAKGKLTPSSCNGGLRLGNSTYVAMQFKVTHAVAIYNRFLGGTNGRVIEFCMGWGDRLVSLFAATNARVLVGCDPNPATYHTYLVQCRAYDRRLFDIQHSTNPDAIYPEPIIAAFDDHFSFRSRHANKHVTVYCSAAEDLRWESSSQFDLAFTSPPYFDTEQYAANAGAAAVANQSWARYPIIDAWHQHFLLHVVKRVVGALAPRGHLCLNIVDSKHAKAADAKTTTVLHAWADGMTSLAYRGYIALLLKGKPVSSGGIDHERCEPLWVWQKM